jgi:transposase-like protein
METLEDGARVSEVARRHGVAAALVFKWRREMRSLAPAAAGFTQIAVQPAPFAAGGVSEAPPIIEAEADGVRLRIPANADREAILAVMEGLAALKRRR